MRQASIARGCTEAPAGYSRLLDSGAFEGAVPQLEALLSGVSAAGEGLTEKGFVAGVKLGMILLVGLLVTQLAYRWLREHE